MNELIIYFRKIKLESIFKEILGQNIKIGTEVTRQFESISLSLLFPAFHRAKPIHSNTFQEPLKFPSQFRPSNTCFSWKDWKISMNIKKKILKKTPALKELSRRSKQLEDLQNFDKKWKISKLQVIVFIKKAYKTLFLNFSSTLLIQHICCIFFLRLSKTSTRSCGLKAGTAHLRSRKNNIQFTQI